ncbi:MAG TPA: cytochrome c oxidase subunit II [Brevundimonas sp.]|uniref:cytochrome c oxidase subunit II n=1 Tax=Brevundimonas sp. TaxID=1871086 RepID=UPI002BEC3FEA|nr:cytochrome c oxidase subunit II [Brevundimonas sp.]HRH20207.1 cytochrome c oxidase subunit II [Brevundimonas sp.]
MKNGGIGMGKGIAGLTALASATLLSGAAWASTTVGQPTPGGIGLQEAASPLKHDAHFFHDGILMPIITGITLLVLGLLIWVVVRYNKKANPTPAKWSHNTTIEVVWTLVPVLILAFIAVFSFRLLYAYNDMPEPDVTVKVTGYQWNWGYEYPEYGISEYISNVLPEAEARAQGVPYLLAADEPMVVPVGQVVRLTVTASDVIHAVALPAFGLKTDAVPGRVNETWFRAERPGIYYGQCSELCGINHAYMPLQINVVTQAEFEQWVASRGGSMTYLADQAAEAAAAEAAEAAAAAAAAAAETAAATEAGTEAGAEAATAEGETTTEPTASAPAAQ